MFLGGAGLADSILFCRHKVYPLGLPNGFSHVLTALAVLIGLFLGFKAAFLPPSPRPVRVSVLKQGEHHGRYSLLMVTTLERLLLRGQVPSAPGISRGALQLIMVERSPMALLRAAHATLLGRLGRHKLSGVFFERGDEIRIEGDHSSVILDGELFEANVDRPIVLKPTAPVPFLRLAA
jgi:hypothetical protein